MRDFIQPSLDGPRLRKKRVQRVTQLVYGFTVEVVALQSYQIQTGKVRSRPGYCCVGKNILNHHRMRTDHGMPTDAAELVYAGKSTDNRMIFDNHVSGEADVIDQNSVITDLAVVGDMTPDHEQAAITHPRDASTASRARLHGNVLADDVVLANDEHAAFASILFILWCRTQTGKGVNLTPLTQTGFPLDHHVGMQAATIAQYRPGSDVAKGPDCYIVPELCAVFDYS